MKVQVFHLHVNSCEEPRGRVWTVRVGRRNHHLSDVVVEVPVWTCFRGADAEQPRAYLVGSGVLRIHTSKARPRGEARYGVITAS